MSTAGDAQTTDLMNDMLVDESEEQLLAILNGESSARDNQLYATCESEDAQDQSANSPHVEEQKVNPQDEHLKCQAC